MTPRRQPNADVALAALIAQQMATALQTFANQLNQTTNESRNKPTTSSPKPSTPSKINRKRKTKRNAITAPVNQEAPVGKKKKTYSGKHPPCNTCQFHHPTISPCRLCTICGRYGHTQNRCRNAPQPNQPRQNQPLAIAPPSQNQGRACFECGDPTHFRNKCPRLIIVNQGARGHAFNINAQEAQANNDEP